MSELLVNTIKKADGTGSLSVPAESGTVVTTASPSLGRRNLIINGAMQVAQRGTSFTSQTGAAFHLDRWETQAYNIGSGQYRVDQSTDSPDGFHFSTKLSCTTVESTQDANEQMYFGQDIEGNNVQHVKFFQANPDTVTFSFWVKSNTTGAYAFTLKLSDNGSSQGNSATRIYATDFTIDSANTWEKKTLSITLDSATSETKVTGNGFSMGFIIWLAAGSSRQSTTPETWSDNGNQATNTITADSFFSSASNYFNITGVQLEVGSVATPFEHRSYGEELALCQRYYQIVSDDISTRVGQIVGSFYSSTRGFASFFLTQELRAIPTVAVGGDGSISSRLYTNGVSLTSTTISNIYPNKCSIGCDFLVSGATAGNAFHWDMYDANAFIYADAEL